MVNEIQELTKEELQKLTIEELWKRHKLIVVSVERMEYDAKELLNDISQRMQFTEGIVLGLLYGIIGNLVVSHYYGVFEGITLARYDSLFWSNLVVFLIGLATIIVLTVIFYRRFVKLRKGKERSRKLMTTIEDSKRELRAMEYKFEEKRTEE